MRSVLAVAQGKLMEMRRELERVRFAEDELAVAREELDEVRQELAMAHGVQDELSEVRGGIGQSEIGVRGGPGYA